MFFRDSNRFWMLVSITAIGGIATGFAVPLAASYQVSDVFQPKHTEAPQTTQVAVVAAPTTLPVLAQASDNRDSEMQKLAARNRRLEALVATLRHRNHVVPKPTAIAFDSGVQPDLSSR